MSIADYIGLGVPPSGGSLEIGNLLNHLKKVTKQVKEFPLRGDP